MGYSIDIISCITDRFVELTATEKRIAQFILDDVQQLAEQTASHTQRNGCAAERQRYQRNRNQCCAITDKI